MPTRWSGLARVAVTGLAGGILAGAGRAAAAQSRPLSPFAPASWSTSSTVKCAATRSCWSGATGTIG
jgi:hypothetical protein